METMITRLFDAVAKRGEELGEPISDADLARAVGVKQAAVFYWRENVTASLKSEHLFRLADYLHVDPRWLATGEAPGATINVNPEPNVSALNVSVEISTLIRRLQNLHTEVLDLVSYVQGLPSMAAHSEQSQDMNISSIHAKGAAATKLIQERQNKGQQHGKHQRNPRGGGKAG
jgi:transcriptional regulator with XRE-family HTH domain